MPVPDLPVWVCLATGSLDPPHPTPYVMSLSTLLERSPRETLGPPGRGPAEPSPAAIPTKTLGIGAYVSWRPYPSPGAG